MFEGRTALTVSGTIPPDLDAEIAGGRRPRADYRVIAERLDADVIDVGAALEQCGRVGSLILRFAGVGPLLAWCLFRHRKMYDVVLTDGEQVGLPFALLCRLTPRHRPRHVMVVHVISTKPKMWLIRLGRLATRIDRYVVYCTPQADVLTNCLGVPSRRVVTMPFMVDTRFFDSHGQSPPVATRPKVCSVGLERRDYPTLLAAVDGLDVDVVIAAASPWSTQSDSTRSVRLPDNVTVCKFDQYELRALYRESRFMVMPLLDVDFQAGITAILEAMSMERAVICTRTVGQTDTLVEGDTGLYVPPGDSRGLRTAILELLADPDRSHTIGENGRRWVTAHADVDVYAAALAAEVRSVVS
jgi:glycosyltransferase involved in cell wall biosynthesis